MKTLEIYIQAIEKAFGNKVVDCELTDTGAISTTLDGRTFYVRDMQDLRTYVDQILSREDEAETELMDKLDAWDYAMECVNSTKPFQLKMKKMAEHDQYLKYFKIKDKNSFWWDASDNDILGICALVGLEIYNDDAVKEEFVETLIEMETIFSPFAGDDVQKIIQLTDNDDDDEYFIVFQVESFM